MQDPELAVQELFRIKELGLKGVQVGSNIEDKNLNELIFTQFGKLVKSLDWLFWFIHGI